MKCLYTYKYPKRSTLSLDGERKVFMGESPYSRQEKEEENRFIQNVLSAISSVLSPEQREINEKCLRQCFRFAEENQATLEIFENTNYLEVFLSFDTFCQANLLKESFLLADEISLFAGFRERDITVRLSFSVL